MTATRSTLTRLGVVTLLALSACTSEPDDATTETTTTTIGETALLPIGSADPSPASTPASPPNGADSPVATAASAPPPAPATPATPAPPPPTRTPAPTTTAPAPTTTVVEFDRMRPGDEGSRVGVVQLKLIVLGYLPAGSETGTYDDATTDAIRRFQSDYALFVDGVVGPQTNRSLTAAAESVNVDG